jgi:hypothetical protein
MAAATTKMAALNSATSSNAIDPNAEDNCDDAETGNAQESNGYEELPELQAVVIDRALHDELTAGPTRPTERLLKGQRAPATCPLPKPRCSPRSVTNGIRRRRRGAMQPAASGEVTYRIARTATDDLPGGTTVEAGRMSCLHTGSA